MSLIINTNGMVPSLGGSASLPSAVEGDALVANADGQFVATPVSGIIDGATTRTQGYYGLLTNFYFTGGQATETVIDENNVDTWIDVEFTVDAAGQFDERPLVMQTAIPAGHTGTGAAGDPVVFSLEGLTQHSSCNFRASMAFIPEIDEGQLDTRLLFTRHSGTSPSDDFSIEEVTLAMSQGADITYAAEPMLSFFVGDTIDTNGVGDAGTCRFQIKSTVEGLVTLRALTWYITA